MSADPDHVPIFSAVSSSARQLFILLRCISFAPRARLQINEDGLRFSVEEARVMQGWLAVFVLLSIRLTTRRLLVPGQGSLYHIPLQLFSRFTDLRRRIRPRCPSLFHQSTRPPRNAANLWIHRTKHPQSFSVLQRQGPHQCV